MGCPPVVHAGPESYRKKKVHDRALKMCWVGREVTMVRFIAGGSLTDVLRLHMVL